MYAEVAIEYPVKSLDKSFTYLVPKEFYNTIKVGMKVTVPFGNKVLNGIVTQINDIKPDYDIKPIKSLENTECILNEEQMDIASFLQKETLCTMISAYQTMLPPALKIKTQDTNYDKYDIYVELNSDINIENYIKSHQKAHKQIEIIDALKDGKKLKKDFPNSTLRILIDNKIVKLLKEKKYRLIASDVVYHELNLNEEQQKAFDSVYSNINKYKVFLLQGVTGSGKTEVYMHLIHKIIESGKTALVLVPEICLTTQTVKRFYDRFGSDVAVFHSGLSSGEKYDEYLKIYRNEVKIVVGTRSSIFVPLRNIGIIIIDEEHSDTYKQDSNPRYDAIEVAKFRAEYHKCPVVLASATPSLEARARAMKGVYQLLTLNKRANKMTLPKVSLVDMTSEIRKRNLIFSDEL